MAQYYLVQVQNRGLKHHSFHFISLPRLSPAQYYLVQVQNRGLKHHSFHFISLPRLSPAQYYLVQVQNRGLKHHSFNFISLPRLSPAQYCLVQVQNRGSLKHHSFIPVYYSACNPLSGELSMLNDDSTMCVSSPNYQSEGPVGDYSPGDNCTWFIKVCCRSYLCYVFKVTGPRYTLVNRKLSSTWRHEVRREQRCLFCKTENSVNI